MKFDIKFYYYYVVKTKTILKTIMVSTKPPKKYIYVVRSGSIENLKTPCLEMYTSSSSYDKEIIGKQRSIGRNIEGKRNSGPDGGINDK